MMKVKAVSKYLRVSQRKVDRILDLIRKKSANEAVVILTFLPHSAAKYALQTVKSAIANASNNYKLEKDKLVVSEAFAGPSTIMKRFRPMSRGRAFSIHKRSCHITIVLEAK